MFERLEVLGALAHLEQSDKGAILAELKKPPPDNYVWMPVGRAGWDSKNREKLTTEIGSEPMKAELAKAGYAQGDATFVQLFITNFQRMSARLGW
jgi:hypothetical protein